MNTVMRDIERNPVGAMILTALLLISIVLAYWGPHRKQVIKKTGLDAPIFRWNERDHLSVRDLLSGGIHAFGRTGAGKTSAFKQIGKAIVGYRNSSILVLCTKKGEAADWIKIAKEFGREDDVVHIAPSQRWRFNMIGHEATRKGEGAGNAANVTRFIMAQRSVVFRESRQGDGKNLYWEKQDERCIGHGVRILQMANKPITAANLHKLILSAPQSVEVVRTDKFQASYCNQCIAEGFSRSKSPLDTHDFDLATDYFLSEWCSMAPETRSSVLVGVIGTLTELNTGIACEMFGNDTNWTPEWAIENRKIVISDAPPDEWGTYGLIQNVGLKYHWQNAILRREVTDTSPIAGIWGDEASLWVTQSDVNYLSRCRSVLGFMVYLCQSHSLYQETLPSDKGKATVEAMLSNFGHKAIFAVGDHDTAEWSSKLCGQTLQQLGGGSTQHRNETLSLFPQEEFSSSFSERFEYLIQPSEFMSGFRTGSPVNKFMVDALLVRSGVPFSNGLSVLHVTFDQRK